MSELQQGIKGKDNVQNFQGVENIVKSYLNGINGNNISGNNNVLIINELPCEILLLLIQLIQQLLNERKATT